MINGLVTVESPVRQQLISSRFVFTLTGSRFFGGYTANSDWDFFIQESGEVERFLSSIGFLPLSFTNYKDELTSKVYRHSQEKIDVQLVKNSVIKLRAQEILYNIQVSSPYFATIFKEKWFVREMFWNFAFLMANSDTYYSQGHFDDNRYPISEVLKQTIKGFSMK